MDSTALSSSGQLGSTHRLPHLIKWIKHKVNNKKIDHVTTSLNENKLSASSNTGMNGCVAGASILTQDHPLSSVSKETLQSSESSIISELTNDSTDTILTSSSGNTLVLDSDKVITSLPTSNFCAPPDSSFNNDNTNNVTAVKVNNAQLLSSDQKADYVCKHSSAISCCRQCMQLPPLPANSDRILRELQRKTRHKLQSQSQTNLSVNNVKDNLVSEIWRSRDNEQPLKQQKICGIELDLQNSHYGFIGKKGELVTYRLTGMADRYNDRYNAKSPEHLYEEIPYSFFQNNKVHLSKSSEIIRKLQKSSSSDKVFQEKKQVHSKSSEHKTVLNVLGSLRKKGSRNTNNNPGSNCNSAKCENAKQPHHLTTLRSHEFYPENMHATDNTKQSHTSNQVSLGNLDFALAKECDGFLVVPLRDRVEKQCHQSGSLQQINLPSKNHPIKEESTHSKLSDNGMHMRTSFMKRMGSQKHNKLNVDPAQTLDIHNDKNDNHMVFNHSGQNNPLQWHETSAITEQSNTNNDINYILSDPAAQNGPPRDTSNIFQSDGTNLFHKHITGNVIPQGVFSPSHLRTQSIDLVGNEPTEKFSHCKKCHRPHALYHGIAVCHSDVEDLTQELQYLDIAGLEKDKLQSSVAFYSSSSLLKNTASRRSAFSKYIPASNHGYAPKLDNGGSDPSQYSEGSNKVDTLSIDAYKRQSMSAESDYFSSNYNTSQSDNVSRTSPDFTVNPMASTARAANYTTGSDRSNDTFSEYDINLEYHQQIESESPSEYDYHLAKIQENLRIKQKVKEIIKSSESERSDYDNFIPDDSISLTSVTSLSELSTLPNDETSFVRSKIHHKTKDSPKNSKKQSKVQQLGSPVDTYVLKMQRTRKPIRKKRRPANNSKGVEYYKLPNFASSQPLYQRTDSNKNQTHSAKQNSINSDNKSDTQSPYSMDSSNKLSCRVTDYQLGDSTKKTPTGQGKGMRPSATVANIRAATADNNNVYSVYSNHNQVKHNVNNRLLSDLMRMNHDRQHFSLI